MTVANKKRIVCQTDDTIFISVDFPDYFRSVLLNFNDHLYLFVLQDRPW